MLRRVKNKTEDFKGAVGGLLPGSETSGKKQGRERLRTEEQAEAQRIAWEAEKAERDRECQRKAVANYMSGSGEGAENGVVDLSEFEGKNLLDCVPQLQKLQVDSKASGDDSPYAELSDSEIKAKMDLIPSIPSAPPPQPCLSGPPADLPPPCPLDVVTEKKQGVPSIAVAEPPSPPPVPKVVSPIDPKKLTSTSTMTKRLSKSGRSRHGSGKKALPPVPLDIPKAGISANPSEITVKEELETVVLREQALPEESSHPTLTSSNPTFTPNPRSSSNPNPSNPALGSHAASTPSSSSFANPAYNPAAFNVQSPLLRRKKTSGFFSWCCGGDDASSSAEELVYERQYVRKQ